MPERGVFLSFEGPEGSGKSTQIERLAERLAGQGRTVVRLREPGGTEAGDRLRAVVLDPVLEIEPEAEFLMYAAARAQLVRERIVPALEAGTDVLCDRYAESSVAYQGYGRGLDVDWIVDVNRVATQGLAPDATFLLDVPTEVGLARIAARGAADRLERADAAFHERVREGFLAIGRARPTWTIVDAQADADAVEEQIWRATCSLIPDLDGP